MATQEIKPWEEFATTPATTARDSASSGTGVVIPAPPSKPEKPTETFRPATREEKIAAGVDPDRAYQINTVTLKLEDVGGQAPAKAPMQQDTNRIPQISTGLNAVQDLRRLSERFLSVGKQAGNVSETPILGSLLGQNRADLEGSIEILKGIIIQDQLARLAKINPAGISSLANTPGEQERFVSSIANLDPNQSPEQFQLGLKRAEDYLKRQLQEAGGAEQAVAPQVDAQGREIVAPELRVAEGAEFSTDADFQRQRDNAEAWAATQGLPFDQALAQFNATMQAKGYGPAGQDTIEILRWYEQNMPGNRAAVQWVLPKSGVRESEAPGRIAALGSGLLTGTTAGLAEEAVNLFDPTAAAKLEAARQYGRENYAGTTLAGEVIGGIVSPLSRLGPGGTILGEAQRGAIYGGLMGAGEAAPDAGLIERIPSALIGATVGGATGGAAQRFFGGPAAAQAVPEGAPIAAIPDAAPIGAVSPEVSPVGAAAPEVAPVGAVRPSPAVAPQAAPAVGAEMTSEELIALAQKAVSKSPGATQARSRLADIAQSNPEARAAAERLGVELPVDVLSDNAQLKSITGLMRSQIGSPSAMAWKETLNDSVARAHGAMDELEATTDLSQVSADVYKRIDDANEALKRQASSLRKEVDDSINVRDTIDASNIRSWLQNRIDNYGGGKKGIDALSEQERGLWNLVSKGNPTYALFNKKRAEVGQALSERSGPWVDSAKADLDEIYKRMADDQMSFVESKGSAEIADKQRAANTLFKEMYRGRERMQKLFGKDLTGNFPQLLQRAINEGRGGNTKTFDVLMKVVPEDMRGSVITSGLFKAAKATDETFSFTKFADLYRDLRANGQIYKNVAKAVGPQGEKLLTDLYAISRRLSDADKAITRTGASTQLNALNSERLLTKILQAVGGAAVAGTAGSMLGGETLAMASAGLAAAAPEIAQRFSKSNAEKLHNLMSSNEFRDLAVSAATNEGLERNINRVASSKTFKDYLSGIGVNPKNGRDWLRSAMTVTTTSGATRQGDQQQPMANPTMKVPQ